MTDSETNLAHQNILIPMLLTTSEQSTQQDTIADLFIFLLRYSFMLNDATNTKNSCDQKTPQFPTPQGNIYMGARYLDPKYSRWISTDPALGEYVPQAPVNDDAKKHNQNLPGMGGLFNSVNLSLFHYAGNNPVRYIDPDGRDIYNITIIGAGVKLIAGFGATFGIAFDDAGKISILTNLNVGIGVEASADTPITPSFSISRGVNISDLKSLGPYRYTTGTTASASAGIGIIYDFDSNEIIGGNILSIGGGVDANLTVYFDFEKAMSFINDLDSDIKESILNSIKENENKISPDLKTSDSFKNLIKALEDNQ